ncbi:cellulose synthase subunit [Trinickia symbiotica]|nr:cellulose biosynthesis cyclic di-GMP-binding regulatory protein BcsB [Trinickia symbiotica]PPK42020.1 cellulose synthase subunit [Trinickia symbiotica]
MSVSLISRAAFRTMCCTLALLSAGAALATERAERIAAAPAQARPAAATPEAKPPTNTPIAAAINVSLATLGNLSGPLRLAGTAASGSISVPLSARETLREAALHLVLSNSVSLLTDRSQLAVRVNDRTIAQLQLSSRQPETTADIRIPTELLRAGYNALTFAVAQHSTENCEDPDAPELWTEIDTTASTLRMQAELRPLAPKLADLGDLIDPRQASPRSIAIVTATKPQSDLQLATGGLLAQGVALRLRYLAGAPRVFEAKPGMGGGVVPGLALAPLAGSDLLLVGTRDALRGYLDAQTTAHIDGAFLGVYPRPDDPRRFMLIASGRNDEEVNRAARAFAHPGLPLPQRSELTIESLDEAALPPWSAGRVVSGTQPHTLRELGFRSRTLRRSERADIDVVLPADIYAPEDAQVVLDFNFTEGAKMREDSVLNLFLNGRFEQVIALDQPRGAVMRHYRVAIPLRSFRSGPNTLSLRPDLVPLITDRCALRQTDNLALTVFDDSTLTLPPASHFTTLPDLKRFADSGFPYTARADGSELAVQIASRDDSSIAAAWALVGKLAQRQMTPLTAAQITFGEPLPGRNTVLVGAAGALPAAQLANAPWTPGRSVRIAAAAPATTEMPLNERAGNWLSRHWGGFVNASAQTAAPADVTLHGTTPLSQQLLVMQYRGKPGAALTVLTAASAAELLQGVTRLVEPSYWNNLDGDIALLTFDQPSLWTAQIGSTYETGTLGAWDWLGFTLSRHPWLGYAALVLLLAVFAASTALLLQRHHRNRHRDAAQ